jgi:hypothetical protein
MRATKLRELGEMAVKVQATASKLPPGPERDNILQEIGRFCSQIANLQNMGAKPTRQGHRSEGK